MTDDKKNSECCFEADGKLVFDPSAQQINLWEKSSEELKEIYKVIPECDIVNLAMEDYSDATGIKFKDGAVVNLGGVEGLPPDLDISNCSEVDMSGRDLSTIPPQVMQEGSTFTYSNRLQNGLGVGTHPFENVDVSHCQRVTITNNDLSKASNLKFRSDASVCLSGCTNIPENLDVSKCSEIDLSGCDLGRIKELKFKDGASVDLAYCTNIPESLDISRSDTVNLSGCDLSQIRDIQFKDGAEVRLSECKNIPTDLDISRCDPVDLSKCDLSNVSNLQFKEGAKINLSESVLPDNLDFSQCDEVDLSGCDLSQVKNIKFKDGAVVNLSGCTNIPADLDVSNCSQVNLSKCDLSNVSHLDFKEGAKINLEKAVLPDNADFSRCDELNLGDCDLGNIKNIKFRDGARVNLQGAQFSDEIDVSRCKEAWLTPGQFDKVAVGEAYIVVGGVGSYDKIDFSKLKNFTVMGTTSHEILGNSYTSFSGSKEFVFRDEAQYQEFLKNDSNIALPKGGTVSFTKQEVAEVMKEDQQKAKVYAHTQSGQLKEEKGSKQSTATQDKGTTHIEPNVSAYMNNFVRNLKQR